MADTLKILGQSNPLATTLTDMYTVPASTSAIASSLTICNQATATASFRVAVAISGAANTAKQYLYYDQLMSPNDTFIATVGVSLAATDVVRVFASSTTLSFNLFGVEVT